MNPKDVKIGGCCFGIPFGCGTLFFLALVAGGLIGTLPVSGTLLLAMAAWTAAAVMLGAVALIATEWRREAVEKRQESRFAPNSR